MACDQMSGAYLSILMQLESYSMNCFVISIGTHGIRLLLSVACVVDAGLLCLLDERPFVIVPASQYGKCLVMQNMP